MMVVRYRLGVLLLLGVAACASPPASPASPPSPASAADDLPSIPVCREEMRAFVELTRLAKQHGAGWVIFAPAVDAMKRQIIDCVEEHAGEMTAL